MNEWQFGQDDLLAINVRKLKQLLVEFELWNGLCIFRQMMDTACWET
jgi:hypothetical protein